MCDLLKGVYAAVGTASADQPYGVVGNLGYGGFDRRLHGARARLRLPALEPAAIVFKT
jgi:hypothetical protein